MKCNIIPQDAPQKIGDSIFRYGGEPFYFKAIGGSNLEMYHIADMKKPVKAISYEDPLFDFSSVPLGYVNAKMFLHVVYLKRIPVRKVKQGVNQHNVRLEILPDGNGQKMFNISNILYSKSFYDATMGRYPSLEDSLDALRKHVFDREKTAQVAVSRNIALSIDSQGVIRVFFKNQYVGWIQPNKFIVHVKNDELGWVVSKYLSHILGWQID
jgi:hypothetical protein